MHCEEKVPCASLRFIGKPGGCGDRLKLHTNRRPQSSLTPQRVLQSFIQKHSLKTWSTSTPWTSPAPQDQVHSQCYSYFYQKDGCVYSSPDQSRCAAPPKQCPQPVPPMIYPPRNESCPPNQDSYSSNQNYPSNQNSYPSNQDYSSSNHDSYPPSRNDYSQNQFSKRARYALARRYDNTEKAFTIGGGSGICRSYDTNNDEGACLWSGPSSNGGDPNTAGWLNGALRGNCNKRLYLQRRDCPDSVIPVRVIDGCSFNTNDLAVGCFQIALTNKTFYKLNPTPQEIANNGVMQVSWDFDNLNGCSPEEGPI
ncbi:hypothetical protein O181_086018 [Austropuccinia psidii MF-1]|uniref:Uncharacterized protein n=1 Tax=Austropuccinia psidii MF-1 TaxID=1389203 RepID=A0A9Q3FU83_9BASI|nr:hypothetical protein [Austropuccinia psidii MF-1]